MRSQKAFINIVISLILQLVTIISGLIIPRLIIGTFGSGTNGLVVSVTTFLSFIVLLEGGIGGVARAVLYKPLANNDHNIIRRIIKSTERLFKIVAMIFVAYLFLVGILYPTLVTDFSYLFTMSLVFIIGITTFVQYYFGITYQILLQADQKLYINSFLQIVTLILNTIVIVILINSGLSIHLVLLCSTIVFLIRPIFLFFYANHKYKLKGLKSEEGYDLKQKWDALGHHIAFYIHRNTDIAILTIFTNIREVSVYSIYYMVVAGVQRVIQSFAMGLESVFGNMIAKGEKKILIKNFKMYGFISFSLTTILFTSTALLIIPFISVYTIGITDANYFRPIFAYILIIAEAIFCIRLPYHSVVIAAGHFKQTKKAAILEAIINVSLSIVLVIQLGVVGVALATLIAMSYRTISYVIYLSSEIIQGSFKDFIKRILVSITSVMITIYIARMLPDYSFNSYIDWLPYAIIITIIASLITLTLNITFFKADFKNILTLIKKLIKKN